MVKHTQEKVDDTYWGIFHPLYTVCKNGGGGPGLFYHMHEANVLLHKQRGEGSLNNELEIFSSPCPRPPTFFPFICVHNNTQECKKDEKQGRPESTQYMNDVR